MCCPEKLIYACPGVLCEYQHTSSCKVCQLFYKILKKDVAKLSIVGAGMMSNPGVAAKMFESLYNAGVNINMISTSEIRVTVLINEADSEKAIQAVHDAFMAED